MNLKIKIMDRQPQVSDEEVKGYMDFDNLLHQHRKFVHRRNVLLKSGAVVLVLSALVAVYLSNKRDHAQESDGTVTSEVLIMRPEETVIPNTADSISAVTGPETSRFEDPESSTVRRADNSASDLPEPQEKDRSRPDSRKQPEEQKAGVESESVYVQAEPVSGYGELFKYFRSNLKYPEAAIKDSVTGFVTVSFIVNTTGDPDNIVVQNSLGEAFDKEAIALIKGMPPWKPATLNGKAVPSKVSLPITFELRKIKP